MSSPGVVVGVDGTVASRNALAWAVEHATATGSRLTAVTAYWAGPVLDEARGSVLAARRSNALHVQMRAIAQLGSATSDRCEIESRVVHGAPAEVLLEASEGERLLVVGTDHERGWRRMVDGSVSHDCLRDASTPVVVVPVEDAAPVDLDLDAEVLRGSGSEPAEIGA
ncbi:MAG: universal stress protein [Nocardioidaceae bacterium]|nr:universal stress protein [Nocardioidaceae bacterium]